MVKCKENVFEVSKSDLLLTETKFQLYSNSGVSFSVGQSFANLGHGHTLIWGCQEQVARILPNKE